MHTLYGMYTKERFFQGKNPKQLEAMTQFMRSFKNNYYEIKPLTTTLQKKSTSPCFQIRHRDQIACSYI